MVLMIIHTLSLCFAVLAIILIWISFAITSDASFYKEARLTNLLQTSTAILISHTSCIAVVIPLGVDFLFDIWGKLSNNSIVDNLWERLLFGLALAFPSIIFVSFRSADNIAMILIALLYSRNICIGATIYMAVYKELKRKSEQLLPFLLSLSLVSVEISATLTFYGVRFGLSGTIQTGSFLILLVSGIALLLGFFLWLRFTLELNRKSNIESFSIDEWTCIAYMVSTILYVVANPIWNIINNDQVWVNRKESSLVFIMAMHFLYSVAVTVIPGRIIRALAISKINSLSLKQVFVRYVSHEIRSPLNVVLAGLELLRADLKDATERVNMSVFELIDDMQYAGETAINILNDLLHYEHMDAGTLKLEQSWKPLDHLFAGKLKWATILAEKKHVNLTITDTIGVISEVSATGDISNRGGLSTNKKHTTLSALSLYLDEFRIDQVIRNLVTNAMKFTPSGGSVDIKMSCVKTTKATMRDKAGMVHVCGFRVEVTDSGSGIAAKDQKAVFGEFIQFNRNEQQQGGGSGLGLWISRRIIHMHEGSIGFASPGAGMGSSFFFELPIYAHEASWKGSNFVFSGVSPCPEATASQMTYHQNRAVQYLESVVETGIQEFSMFETNENSTLDHHNDNSLSLFSASTLNHKEFFSSTPGIPDSESCQLNDHIESTSNGLLGVGVKVFPSLQSMSDHLVDTTIKHLRILIVDDSDLNRKILRRQLQCEAGGILQNAVIMEADDGLTALETVRVEMASGRSFDYILMDFVMRQMNGPEAVKSLRTTLGYTGVILGITGNALPEDLLTFRESGVNDVLIKPLSKAKLLAAFEEHNVGDDNAI